MGLLRVPARIAAVTLAVALFGAVELRAEVASADSISANILMLRQRSMAASGTATGNATAGPAVAANDFSLAQVIMQTGGSGANTSQVAVNQLNLDQTAVATSGNATGLNGGRATSGPATTYNIAIVGQSNTQSISGAVPSGGVEQTAVNFTDIRQNTAAASGDATANGAGSTASSGAATSTSAALVEQQTTQTYTGPSSGSASGSVRQNASSVATLDQTTGAVSGRATASVSSTGNSGSASSSASTRISQGTVQVAP